MQASLGYTILLVLEREFLFKSKNFRNIGLSITTLELVFEFKKIYCFV